MKKTITKKVKFCDKCSKEMREFEGYSCDNCELEVCYECKSAVVTFPHSLYCSGSGDACYCPKCITALTESGDKRLAAFLGISQLRQEAGAYNKAFELRVKTAEALVAGFPRKERA